MVVGFDGRITLGGDGDTSTCAGTVAGTAFCIGFTSTHTEVSVSAGRTFTGCVAGAAISGSTFAGKSVSTPADVRKVVASARTDGKRSVLMRVKKGENTRFVALPVGNG